MEIITVSRSSFTKSGKCKHTHSINFTSMNKANSFVKSSKAIDALYAARNKKYPKWEYSVSHKTVY